VKRTLGFDITFVTSTNHDDHARELLAMLGMPFRQRTTPKALESAEAFEAAA
jgi:large subunit ribosomal protein L5